MKKCVVVVLVLILVLMIPLVSLAHSGRTDSDGGHYDRTTGEYHYHHGYGEHQHPDGVCPYSKPSSSSKTSYSSSDCYRCDSLESEINSLKSTIDRNEKDLEDRAKTIKALTSEKNESERTFRKLLWWSIVFEVALVIVIISLSVAVHRRNEEIQYLEFKQKGKKYIVVIYQHGNGIEIAFIFLTCFFVYYIF